MKWVCQACGGRFRRFSRGEGVCPKCRFVPSWEADDDTGAFEYWDFHSVFEFRKWLRRKIKVLRRALCL